MAHISAALILGAFGLFLYYLRIRLSQNTVAQHYGCELPPKRTSRDPILGLDVKIQDAKLAKDFQSLPAGAALFRQYGQTFRATTLFRTVLKTMNTENIQTVYALKGKDWGVQPFRLPAMRPFCGLGFITTDGSVWERSRALLKPSFHKSNISDLTDFEDSIKHFLSSIPKDGSTIDLQPLLSLLFVDTSTRFLLGQSLEALASDESADSPVDGKAFLRAFQLSLRSCGIRIYLGPFRFMMSKSASVMQWKIVHQFIDYYIERALKDTTAKVTSIPNQDANQTAIHQHRSLLDGLAKQTSDRIEIRDQIIQGMMAAQDTTAVLISNSMFLLSRSPAIWERLRAETASVSPQPLTLEDTKRFRLLRNILYESLRLYPVFPLLARVALTDTILPTGGGIKGDRPIFVAAGTRLLSDFYTLHRSEAVYGPEVEKFNPDRWESINPSPFQYMAFGGGLRGCLGQQKAIGEAACTLIRIAQAFKRIESRDDRDWAGDQKLVAKNANGCKVALVPA